MRTAGLKAALTALLLFSAAAAAVSGGEQVYRIGTDEDYPPMSFMQDGVARGIDVEILQRAAQLEDFAYELVPLEFDAVIPKLVSGQLDAAMSSLNITPKRAAIMDFSEVYMVSTLSAVVRCSQLDRFKYGADFFGKSAAVKTGTYASEFVEHDSRRLHVSLQYYSSTEECAQAVAQGKADFLIEDYPVAAAMQQSADPPQLCLTSVHLAPISGYGFAVAKGENQELLLKFNRALHTMQQDGSLERIFRRYLKNVPVSGPEEAQP